MECIKKKKFLFWKWVVIKHDYVIHRISKFMITSDTFHVTRKCSVCGIERTEKFVDQDYLLKIGIPVDEIDKIDDWGVLISDIKLTQEETK